MQALKGILTRLPTETSGSPPNWAPPTFSFPTHPGPLTSELLHIKHLIYLTNSYYSYKAQPRTTYLFFTVLPGMWHFL